MTIFNLREALLGCNFILILSTRYLRCGEKVLCPEPTISTKQYREHIQAGFTPVCCFSQHSLVQEMYCSLAQVYRFCTLEDASWPYKGSSRAVQDGCTF